MPILLLLFLSPCAAGESAANSSDPSDQVDCPTCLQSTEAAAEDRTLSPTGVAVSVAAASTLPAILSAVGILFPAGLIATTMLFNVNGEPTPAFIGGLLAFLFYAPPVFAVAVPLFGAAFSGLIAWVASRNLYVATGTALAAFAVAVAVAAVLTVACGLLTYLAAVYLPTPPLVVSALEQASAGGDENGFVLYVLTAMVGVGATVGLGLPLGALLASVPTSYAISAQQE